MIAVNTADLAGHRPIHQMGPPVSHDILDATEGPHQRQGRVAPGPGLARAFA
jgi:hypothetical protein